MLTFKCQFVPCLLERLVMFLRVFADELLCLVRHEINGLFLASPRNHVPLVGLVGILQVAAFTQEQLDVCCPGENRERQQVFSQRIRVFAAVQTPEGHEVDRDIPLNRSPRHDTSQHTPTVLVLHGRCICKSRDRQLLLFGLGLFR